MAAVATRSGAAGACAALEGHTLRASAVPAEGLAILCAGAAVGEGCRAAAAAAAVLASQAAGPAWQAAGAAACGVTLGVSGRRRGRLSASGMASAC